jgi:hypothetical protein
VVSSESPAHALQSWLSHKRRRRKRTRRGVGSRSKLIEEEEEEEKGGGGGGGGGKANGSTWPSPSPRKESLDLSHAPPADGVCVKGP